MGRRKVTHSFRIVARFGPGDLLRLMNTIRDEKGFREEELDFEFDWMKRRIAFSARTEEGARRATEALLSRAEKKAGAGHLLAGKAVREEAGRVTIPIGVAIQEPEVFREMLVGMLYEAGIMGITEDPNDGGHFLVRPRGPGASLPWREVITSFPLPEYLKLEERKIED